MLSKRHYEAIAEQLKASASPAWDDTARAVFPTTAKEQWFDIVGRIASYFAADNPRFDRARFLRACGMEEEQ